MVLAPYNLPFQLVPHTHHRKAHVVLHGHHHLHLVKIATPGKHLVRETVSVWRLPAPVFLLALVVFLGVFDLLILLGRLLRALCGDDNIIIRIFVRVVVVFVLNVVARVRILLLGIRGTLLLLSILGLLAWDAGRYYNDSRLPQYRSVLHQAWVQLMCRRQRHSMLGLH